MTVPEPTNEPAEAAGVSDSAGSDNTPRGIACVVAASILITTNDAVIKWLSDEITIGQIIAVRGVFMLAPVAILVWWLGGRPALRVRDHRAQAIRAALFVAATLLFLNGLGMLPLADATAIVFAEPLFVTLLAISFLGERVGWRRFSAIAVGFLGVLLMVRPTGDAFRLAALLPLGAALCIAAVSIMTRRMSRTETTASMLVYGSVAIMVAGFLTAFAGNWWMIGLADLGLLAICAILFGFANFLLIEGLRLAEASVVIPYRYVSLVWALVLGLVLWRQLPDAWTASGALLVVACGLYIWRREARTKT
jgi:drug/metabolite transporter (DMT)-like permease